MGFGGISIWQLLIILAIVVLIFGTKKLRNMGSDVGGAVKNFKDSMNADDSGEKDDTQKRVSSEDADSTDNENRQDDRDS